MPSSAQTRSTEPHAGVLNHEKEEPMDKVHHNRISMMLIMSLLVLLNTLLVDANVALIISILHETTVKHRHLALSTKKSGKEGLKMQNRIKYCSEKTYDVEVK